jgi:gluconokinase
VVAVILILMGVSGSGKTTVGRLLAHDLGWPFVDADDYHPPANVEKMRRGEALTDADRAPWLDALHEVIAAIARDGRSAVLACSALKQAYRDRLVDGIAGVRFVYLRGDASLIRLRLARRSGHFMPVALLQSQVDTLEEPVDALAIDIDAAPQEIAARIREHLD